MTARVLVVDDILSNVKLLEAKLSAEYFDVVTASDGETALKRLETDLPDIVLLDVMMPGMDGFEVCRRIKANIKTAHIPVVMVTALDQSSDRVAGLEAGADDFLTKPVDDTALFARVRSLVRLKMMTDELRMREETGQSMGLVSAGVTLVEPDPSGRILIVEDRPETVAWFHAGLESNNELFDVSDFEEAIVLARGGDFVDPRVALFAREAIGEGFEEDFLVAHDTQLEGPIAAEVFLLSAGFHAVTHAEERPAGLETLVALGEEAGVGPSVSPFDRRRVRG